MHPQQAPSTLVIFRTEEVVKEKCDRESVTSREKYTLSLTQDAGPIHAQRVSLLRTAQAQEVDGHTIRLPQYLIVVSIRQCPALLGMVEGQSGRPLSFYAGSELSHHLLKPVVA